MIARLRRAARRDDGASAVEFAFIGTLIVIPLVFGAISFGMVFAGNLSLSNAARQAARIGTVVGASPTSPPTCQNIVDEVKGAAPGIGLRSTNLPVEIQLNGAVKCQTNGTGTFTTGSAALVPCANAATGSEVTVYARSFTTIFFIPPYFFKSSGYPLEGKGVYRCEFK